jgi:hypothetical protein
MECLSETVCQPAGVDVMSDTLAEPALTVNVNLLRELCSDILPQHRQLRACFIIIIIIILLFY